MPEDGIELSFNKTNSVFGFYEYLGYCSINSLDPKIEFNSLTITKIKLLNEFVDAFLIESDEKRVIYCPCHAMHFPIKDEFKNVNLFIMGLGHMDEPSDEITNFERDNLRIIEKLQPQKVIFTHIEEDNQLSYDDYTKLESKYNNIIFGYDGMNISV